MKSENKFEDVISRVKVALKITGDSELAEQLGMSRTAFSNRRTKGSIPYEKLTEVLSSRNVDLRWVFTGNVDTTVLRDASFAAIEVALQFSSVGRGLLQEMQEAAFAERLTAEQLLARFKDRLPGGVSGEGRAQAPDQYQQVPRGSVQIAPSVTLACDQIVDHLAFKRDWMARVLGITHEDVLLVEVRGDSMKGTFNDGDSVLVDMRQRKFDASDLYALKVADLILIKRVQHNLNGTITIKSDNASYECATLDAAQLEGINVIGRVVWPRSR